MGEPVKLPHVGTCTSKSMYHQAHPGTAQDLRRSSCCSVPTNQPEGEILGKKNCDKENQPKGGSKIMRILVLGIRHIVQKRQRHKKIYHPKVPPFIVIRRFLKSRSVHAATGLKRVDRQPIEQQPFRNMVIKAAYNSTPLFLCW